MTQLFALFIVDSITILLYQVSFSYKVETGDSGNEFSRMRDHVIDGRNLLPATGYLYLVWKALATAAHTTVQHLPLRLTDVTLHQVNCSQCGTFIIYNIGL